MGTPSAFKAVVWIGTSPPTTKFASTPFEVTRVGFARRRASPLVSSALITMSISAPAPARRLPTKLPKGTLVLGRPVLVRALDSSTPNSRPAVRLTSRMRTSSCTCCGSVTRIALITGWSLNCPASSSTRAKDGPSRTSPETRTRPLILATDTSALGTARLIACCRSLKSTRTLRIITPRRDLLGPKNDTFVAPVLLACT